MAVRIYDAEVSEGVALWPEERPWEWLMAKKRVTPRPVYNAQYRNDPSGMRGVRYDVTWLGYYTASTLPPLSTLDGIQGGDPATSERSTSNYFGHTTAAKDSRTGIVYILGFAFANIEATKHLEFLRSQYTAWGSRGLHIRKVLLEELGPIQATTQNLALQTRLDPKGAMPLEVVKPKGSKEQRFDSMLPYLENGTVLFKGQRDASNSISMSEEKGFQEFAREYSRFPKGGRDDVLDALWIVVNELVSGGIAATARDDREYEEEYTEYTEESVEERRKRIQKALDEYDERKKSPEKFWGAKERVLGRRGMLFH